MTEIASELVREKIDVIITYGSAAVKMRQATASIPIVFAPAVDPVGIGLVASLSRPGGNATGMSVQHAEVASKRLELLRGIVPRLGKLAILLEEETAAIEFRWANGEYNRLPDLAADLIEHRVSVIVTSGGNASAPAAKTATTTLPIVSLVTDNLTGVNFLTYP